MLILSVGRIFASDFGLFYQIPKNSGALYNVTQTIDVYVYNALMKNADYGMSSAASVFQSIVGFLFVIVACHNTAGKQHRENAQEVQKSVARQGRIGKGVGEAGGHTET